MIQNYFRLFFEYRRVIFTSPVHSIIFIFGIIVSSFTQLLSFGTLYPIILYVINKESKENKFIIFFEKLLRFFYFEANLLNLLILFIFLSAISAALYILIQLQQSFMIRNIEIKTRSQLTDTVINSEWTGLLHLDHGRFLNAATREVERYRDLIKYMFMITASILQVIVYLSYAIWLTPVLVMISMGILFVNFVMFLPILKLYFNFATKWTELINSTNNIIIQIERGIKFIKANSMENHVLEGTISVIRNAARVHMKGHLLGVLQSRLAELMAFFVFAIILYISNEILKLDIGILFLILALFYKIIPEVKSVIDFSHNATSLLPSSVEINYYLKNYQKEIFHKEVLSLNSIENIVLDKLLFHYDNKVVIPKLSVEFQRGEFWAIIGKSGSGKTTLLDLISGILKPTSGDIFYNSVPQSSLNTNQLHDKICYMTQEPFIIEGTIIENICWGIENPNPEKLESAIRIAQIHFWEDSNRSNTKTIVQGGLNISGGQKQRIGIARALIGNYDFILFDEPTSSLDAETEVNFINELAKLKGTVGIIMVSHRPECLKIADRILEFAEDGNMIIKS